MRVDRGRALLLLLQVAGAALTLRAALTEALQVQLLGTLAATALQPLALQLLTLLQVAAVGLALGLGRSRTACSCGCWAARCTAGAP